MTKLLIRTDQKLDYVNSSTKIKPTAIVLHWWNVPSWFGGINYFLWRMKTKKLSVQYVILKDGTLFQLVETPTVLCHHARCANSSSIGIELQGFGAKDLDRQTDQFESLVKLVAKLTDDYPIPVDSRVEENGVNLRFYGITSHKEVDKHCPGKRRIIPKRDVHDEYVVRVKDSLATK